MKIRLGYVAIATSLDNVTTSRLLTYTHFKKLGVKRGIEKLKQIIGANLDDLKKILHYNIKNEIYFYRMSSSIFPLATIPEISDNLLDLFEKQLSEIGNIINVNNIRVDMHVDHFYVLNSVNEDVVTSTINILNFYKNIFKYMNINGKLIMHVGSKAVGKKEGMKRFETNFARLDDDIKKLIILENDDKVYNIKNVLSLSKKINVPVVLDYHHFICNKTNEKIEDYILKIFETWKNETPKIHFSSPQDKKNFRSHHNYIDINSFLIFLEKIKFVNYDFDIMIEAKAKDEALFRLIRQIKYETNYKFIKNTIFLI